MSSETFNAEKLLEEIAAMDIGNVKLMEVCGTHTMAIAKSGLKSSLPANVKLLSGPGCPVCVTPPEVIDAILELAMRENVMIATYGDMIKVPGSVHGKNLGTARAMGARVEVVYSPVDAVELAQKNPGCEVVFLGVGFETTAPGTAAAISVAEYAGVENFSVLSMLKRVEPALRALAADEEFDVAGFLCPGHVATIIGARGFAFLEDELKIPAVIAGFEAKEILCAIYRLLRQIEEAKPRVENEYARAVRPEGNPLAMKMVWRYLEPRRDIWRGLGEIEESGMGIRGEYAKFDAEKKFGIVYKKCEEKSPCRCGDVICGKLDAVQCPLFGKACVPENPVGPCMVSGEGACAAAYKYRDLEE